MRNSDDARYVSISIFGSIDEYDVLIFCIDGFDDIMTGSYKVYQSQKDGYVFRGYICMYVVCPFLMTALQPKRLDGFWLMRSRLIRLNCRSAIGYVILVWGVGIKRKRGMDIK